MIPYDPHFFMVRTDGPEATAPLMRRVKKKHWTRRVFFGDVLTGVDVFFLHIIGYSWDIHRIFMGYSWDIHGIFMGYSWDIHGD